MQHDSRINTATKKILCIPDDYAHTPEMKEHQDNGIVHFQLQMIFESIKHLHLQAVIGTYVHKVRTKEKENRDLNYVRIAKN